jgi:hypothetical protein
MGASYRVKRIGRADQARQLPGSADPPRALFLRRRSFCAISRRYSLADPQLQRRYEHEPKASCAWRLVVSMHSLMRKQRRVAGRPGALPNPRRERAQKAGGPTCEKGVRCVRPTIVYRYSLLHHPPQTSTSFPLQNTRAKSPEVAASDAVCQRALESSPLERGQRATRRWSGRSGG